MILKTDVFCSYSHLCIYVWMYLCIYIATHLDTVYLDWLQAVLESSWRCAWQWRLGELRVTLWGRDRASLEIHLQALIEWISRCSPTWWSCVIGDLLGSNACANLEAVIDRIWRYTRRPWSSEFGDALGEHDHANLKAVTERVWIWTCRPWLCELGCRNCASLEMHMGSWVCKLGGCNEASLEIHLMVVSERGWTSTRRQSKDSAPDAETAFIR